MDKVIECPKNLSIEYFFMKQSGNAAVSTLEVKGYFFSFWFGKQKNHNNHVA